MRNAMPSARSCCSMPSACGILPEGSDDQRIDAAIAATRQFFEQMGVPTRLSDYGLDGSSIPALLAKLEETRHD